MTPFVYPQPLQKKFTSAQILYYRRRRRRRHSHLAIVITIGYFGSVSFSKLAKQKNKNSIHAWAETTFSV